MAEKTRQQKIVEMEQFTAQTEYGQEPLESGVTLEKKAPDAGVISEVKAWGKIFKNKLLSGKSKIKTIQKRQSKMGAKAMQTMKELKEQTK